MNKRLLKRHKRQVLRGRQKVGIGQPGVRAPEQVREDRAGASRGMAASVGLKGYPEPGQGGMEDMPAEWANEDREMEGRKPDLGETEEDPSER